MAASEEGDGQLRPAGYRFGSRDLGASRTAGCAGPELRSSPAAEGISTAGSKPSSGDRACKVAVRIAERALRLPEVFRKGVGTSCPSFEESPEKGGELQGKHPPTPEEATHSCATSVSMALPVGRPCGNSLAPLEVVRRRPADRRIHHGYAGWQRLVPTHSKVQYAGSIGIASAGFGWDYGRRGQWETDLLVGVIPSYHSDSPKLTLTLKTTCVPWSIGLNDRFSFEPFACGLFLSTILSENFWVREPDRYPKGYYTFSTRIRSHVFVGQRFSCEVNTRRRDRNLRSVSLYYELGTCDFYLISALANRTLRVKELLSLSFGVKFQMFNPNEEYVGR